MSLVVETVEQLNAVRPQSDIWSGNMSLAHSCHELVKRTVNNVLAPCICVFGIVGNLLNLVVLTRHRLQRCMDFIDKSSNIRFLALAVSDLILCVIYLSTLTVPLKAVSCVIDAHTPYLTRYFLTK